jgi:hypothetical protein
MIKTVYLVVGADKRVRAVSRPRLAADEIAFTVRLRFPDNWGRVQAGVIDIEVPDFAPTATPAEVVA